MEQMIKLDGLVLTSDEVNKIEVQTRLQSKSPLWYRIWKHRVTASSIGDIYKRRGNEDTLVKRLKSTRHVTTAAMRQGIALEPKAAKCYAEANRNNVNIYPCGVIVSQQHLGLLPAQTVKFTTQNETQALDFWKLSARKYQAY